MEKLLPKVIKRDSSIVDFDKEKIKNAIIGANNEVDEVYKIWCGDIDDIVNKVVEDIKYEYNEKISVEDISTITETRLMIEGYYEVARKFIKYRYSRALSREFKKRDDEVFSLVSGENEELNKENSNKDTRLLSTMRDYMAGIVSKDIAKRIMLPKDLAYANEEGLIHIHDLDYSPCMPMYNCSLINLEDMLQNGTVISGTMIEKPHSFRTACTIVTQIITQVASNQYGGNTITLSHLAPFVDISRQKIRKEVENELANVEFFDDCEFNSNIINTIVENRLREEIKDGIQTIQYQLITMSTTNGQAPFTSVFMYLDEVPEGRTRDDLAMIIEEMLKQRIAGVKNEKGVPITTAFPKLLYVLDEDNIYENSKYYYLTQLAAECSSKRLVPDYISAKKMKEYKEGNVFPCMGCRSFLQPYKDGNGNYKFYGRFNQGVCTINLVDVALSSNGDFDKFWSILNERLEMCYRVLMIRHNRLIGTPSDVAPILWQHGAIARLKPGETIDKLLFNDYSSISLGYAGLYECIKYMTGESQLEENGYNFGIKVMQALNDACAKWKAETNIGFSVYGSPIESTTYKFAKCLKKRFGIIEGITDKDYVTNSYHITPAQDVDAFTKLTVESNFQRLSLGGAISYVETPSLEKNVDAILEIIKHIYNNIMYAEINTTTSYCQVCGCTDIKMGDDLKFHCPNCGNDDFNKMNVAVRICGYISTNPFNDGRAQDIHDRVYHLGME